MSRFFVPPENIGDRTIEITDRGDLRHMKKVLRLRAGDEVDVSDTERFEYRAIIESIDDDVAVLTIVDKQAFAREPETEVTLFQGIPKQGKMESIIQKCVELGVKEIVPVFMKRTVVVDKGNNMSKKTDRWNKVSTEAVKQCRRGVIPKVRDPIGMAQVMEELGEGAPGGYGPYDLVIIPYENEEDLTIKDVLREWKTSSEEQGPDASVDSSDDSCHGPRIAVMIGPEGGFTEDEVDGVVERGGKAVTLGRTTLRTETAGPATLAMIMYELEL